MRSEVMNISNFPYHPAADCSGSNYSPITLLTPLLLIPFLLTLKPGDKPKCYPLLFLVYALIMLTIFPLFFLVIVVFWTLKRFLSLILRIRHGSKFGGMLSGHDMLWLVKDSSNPNIKVLLLISKKSEENVRDVFLRNLKRKIPNTEANKKVYGVFAKFCGYSYLIKDQINMDQCVKVLDYECYKDEEALRSTLSQTVNLNNGPVLDFKIGCHPLNWGERKTCYPVIVTVHHGLADGFAVLQYILNIFDDNAVNKPAEPLEDDCTFVQKMIKASIRCMHLIVIIYNLPLVMSQRSKHKADANCVHGDTLSGKKEIFWRNEVNVKYVKMVKEIKRRLPGTAFFDIVSAALSSAFSKLLEKKQDTNIEFTMVIPAVPNSLRLQRLKKRRFLRLENRFTIGVLTLPSQPFSSCVTRLESIKRRTFELKNSYEFQVHYWIFELLSLLPEKFINPLLRSSQTTMAVSNLPGPKKMHLFCDYMMEDILFWIPHRGLSGVALSIFSYDDRFSLGLSVDKIYKLSRQDLQGILDDMFKYFEDLDLETSIKY